MSLQTDPRWIEFGNARRSVSEGLSAPAGAHERHRQALLPYCELLAEQCEASPHMRPHMMAALLYGSRLPLGIIAAAFKATKEEMDFVRNREPAQAEPVDEIDRLNRMSYGTYLRTEHWKRVREDALRRADGRCALCNAAQGLEVHHRTYERRGCERPADVIVLCGSCHSRQHGKTRAA